MYAVFILIVLLGGIFLAAAPAFDLLVTRRAVALVKRGDRAGARALLERVLRLPPMSGERKRVGARYLLGVLYLYGGEADRAIEQYRLVLALRLTKSFEGGVRRYLSLALEAANQPELAQRERKRAEAIAAAAPATPEAMIARARLLADLHQYDEARELYARAIPRLPAGAREKRILSSVQMARVSLQSGQPQEAADWAEKAIALRPCRVVLDSARSVAVFGYDALGRLDDAERHVRQALAEARDRKDRKQKARALVRMARLQGKHGQLVQAMETCSEASRVNQASRRSALLVEADCRSLLGEFDAARAVLEAARAAPPLSMPSAERGRQGAIALRLSALDGRDGQLEAAWTQLGIARKGFGGERKMQLGCDVQAAQLLARAGPQDEAEQMVECIEALAAPFSADRSTQLAVTAGLARVAFRLEQFVRSQALWERYLSLRPDPVYEPSGWYHLGECHEKQGNPAAARAAYEQAARAGFETRHTRMAADRLKEMSESSPDFG